VSSLIVTVLAAVVSGAGLYFRGSLYAPDAFGVTAATAGVLVPGFLAHDAFNLVVGLPVLIGTMWLARRGSLIGLLLCLVRFSASFTRMGCNSLAHRSAACSFCTPVWSP